MRMIKKTNINHLALLLLGYYPFLALANYKISNDKFHVKLPSAEMKMTLSSKWEWHDSCHSLSLPCYQGLLRHPNESTRRGSAYLFATPLPKQQYDQTLSALCTGIYALQAKISQTYPEENRPNSLQFKKNTSEQSYCSWKQGGNYTYLWKTKRSMISIAFSAASDDPSFLNEVENFTHEVSLHEE